MTDEEQLSMEMELEVRRSLMASLRIPNEAELIELENEVLAVWEFRAQQTDGFVTADRIAMNLRLVLDLARTVQNP